MIAFRFFTRITKNFISAKLITFRSFVRITRNLVMIRKTLIEGGEIVIVFNSGEKQQYQ